MSARQSNSDPSGLQLRAALAGGIAWLLWRAWRGACAMFWIAFGLGMAAWWTRGLRWLF